MYPPLLNDLDSQHLALLKSLSLNSPTFLSMSFPTSYFKSLMLPSAQQLIIWPLTTASPGQDPSCSCLPCMIIYQCGDIHILHNFLLCSVLRTTSEQRSLAPAISVSPAKWPFRSSSKRDQVSRPRLPTLPTRQWQNGRNQNKRRPV